jgi:pimeloyl-ACP methyl ester carboxylesterase
MRALVALVLTLASLAVNAKGGEAAIGVVVMHGKGGGPTKLVAGLAKDLEKRGYLVANLEMPWSGPRQYDVDVPTAEGEVRTALAGLRERGAKKVFIAGHSQGGLFALYLGGRLEADGIIAIAPGGNVASNVFREKIWHALSEAEGLVARGKGAEKARLADYENERGVFNLTSPPAAYVTWFRSDGAMNMSRAVASVNARIPVLFIVPTADYPGLLRQKDIMFGRLPQHPLTKLYEPAASHKMAACESREEIARWMAEVSGR